MVTIQLSNGNVLQFPDPIDLLSASNLLKSWMNNDLDWSIDFSAASVKEQETWHKTNVSLRMYRALAYGGNVVLSDGRYFYLDEGETPEQVIEAISQELAEEDSGVEVLRDAPDNLYLQLICLSTTH